MIKRFIGIVFVLLFGGSTISCANDGAVSVKGKIVYNLKIDATMPDVWIFEKGKSRRIADDVNNPMLSPDGALIAFTEKKRSIVLCDMAGNRIKTISSPGIVGLPVWSPNREKVYYSCLAPTEEVQFLVHEYNLKTNTETLLLDLTPQGLGVGFFDVDRTGRFLAISASNWHDRSAGGVYVYDLGTKDLKKIRQAVAPMWFPDGKHIAYFTNIGYDGKQIDDFGAIFKYNIETGEETRLMSAEFMSFGMRIRISPNGKYIYYASGGGICMRSIEDPTKIKWIVPRAKGRTLSNAHWVA